MVSHIGDAQRFAQKYLELGIFLPYDWEETHAFIQDGVVPFESGGSTVCICRDPHCVIRNLDLIRRNGAGELADLQIDLWSDVNPILVHAFHDKSRASSNWKMSFIHRRKLISRLLGVGHDICGYAVLHRWDSEENLRLTARGMELLRAKHGIGMENTKLVFFQNNAGQVWPYSVNYELLLATVDWRRPAASNGRRHRK